ncbi:MAG TPA: hypothetical protein VJ438_06045 [Candidatus Nanoarchaeia archaeon]|nr:hypothetical protein [Candidatus Nanoarchaeia archaeon]
MEQQTNTIKEQIKPFIVLHQNKKIDVLSTYWNIPEQLRLNFCSELNINPSPFHILNNTNKIRLFLNSPDAQDIINESEYTQEDLTDLNITKCLRELALCIKSKSPPPFYTEKEVKDD